MRVPPNFSRTTSPTLNAIAPPITDFERLRPSPGYVCLAPLCLLGPPPKRTKWEAVPGKLGIWPTRGKRPPRNNIHGPPAGCFSKIMLARGWRPQSTQGKRGSQRFLPHDRRCRREIVGSDARRLAGGTSKQAAESHAGEKRHQHSHNDRAGAWRSAIDCAQLLLQEFLVVLVHWASHILSGCLRTVRCWSFGSSSSRGSVAAFRIAAVRVRCTSIGGRRVGRVYCERRSRGCRCCCAPLDTH